MSLFSKKSHISFDPDVFEPAVRKSICTGEMTAGFVEKETGKFRDVKLVKSQAELEEFMHEIGATSWKTVY